MKFYPIGALFSIGTSIVEILIRIINLITWGKIGRMWMVKLSYWELNLKITKVWSDE